MADMTRRSWIKTNVAIAAGAGAASSLPKTAHATLQGKITLSHVLSLNEPKRLKLCRQMGVTHVVSTPSLRNIGPDQYALSEVHVRTHTDFCFGDAAGKRFIKSETRVRPPNGTPFTRDEVAARLAAWEGQRQETAHKRVAIQSPWRTPLHFSRARPAALATA